MKNIVYIYILVGVMLVFFANSNGNKYLLVLGVVFLMLGLFRVNKRLTSNQKKDNLEVKVSKGKEIEDE